MRLQPFAIGSASLDAGTAVLEASAGTGKTWTLVGLLLRCLLEGRIERLDQALVVTFTVAATEELKNRLRAALQRTLRATAGGESDEFFAGLAARPGARAKLAAAIATFDQVGIATIHGFCKRVLEEAAFETHEPFRLDFTADPLPLLHRAAGDALRSLYEEQLTARSVALHFAKLTPESLVASYRLWQRYPSVQLQPANPRPELPLADLEQALAEAAASADAAARESLLQVDWLADKSPFLGDAASAIDRLFHRLTSEPLVAATLAAKIIGKRAKVGSQHHFAKPFCLATARIATSLDAARDHLRSALLQRMHERVRAHKQTEHVLSFDDLLARTHTALHDPKRGPLLLAKLRQRWQVALIDEFQDTDSLQYAIFATCFAERPMFLIGDPKQSIYGFRGANLRTYCKARDAAVRAHTLAINYRSSGPMVAAVGALFARIDAFAAPAITMPTVQAAAAPHELRVDDPADGAALCWRWLPPVAGKKGEAGWLKRELGEERIVADVAAEIARLLRDARIDGRALRPGDIAVLTRANRQATRVQDELRRIGVRSAIGKAGDIFQTDELGELEHFLQAVLRPTDLGLLRGALASRLCGRDLAEVRDLEADDEALQRELDRLETWRRLWLRSGFITMVEHVLVDCDVHRRYLALPDGDRRLTNLRQLFELLHDAEHAGRLSPEALVEWLQRERTHEDELDYTVRELRLESDGDAVQILTVHGSKGLQYEVVFCPFLWDGKGPRSDEVLSEGDAHRIVFGLDADSDEGHAVAAERLSEELRLCYVALTRAKRRCYVHVGVVGSAKAGASQSSLGWLLTPRPHQTNYGPDGKPDPAWAQNHCKRVRSDALQWEQVLQRLGSTCPGAMSVVHVPDEPQAQPRQPTPAPTLPQPRRPGRKVAARGLHSFTSLTTHARVLEAAPDVQDPAHAAVPATSTSPPRGIFAFARGAAAGQCLHDVLEHADFGALQDDATQALVRSTLAAHGLVDAGSHDGELDPVPTVRQLLSDLAATTLHAGGPTVGSLCTGTHTAEWQFLLPATEAQLSMLASNMARHGSAAAIAQAERLRTLPRQTLRGFLTGFVDLVAAHDDRFYVLDWKSNHLGNHHEDYGPGALQHAMLQHDYVLQYHLYVLALHRHLRQRLPDYRPQRHLGGVGYVFLRGVRAGSHAGVFFDNVHVDLVAAMDQWLDGPTGGSQ